VFSSSFSLGTITLPWLQVTDSTHNTNCVRLELDSPMAAITAAHLPHHHQEQDRNGTVKVHKNLGWTNYKDICDATNIVLMIPFSSECESMGCVVHLQDSGWSSPPVHEAGERDSYMERHALCDRTIVA
jgi:hypothetical protein